jgi:hypothetical protein
MKRFFKKLAAGIIGADVFLVIGILVFALIKLIYILIKKDLLISKYNIALAIAIFLALGFFYGIRTFHKRTINSKLFKLNWINFWMTIMLALVFSLGTYIILREGFNNDIGIRSFIGIVLMLILLMYPFCALLSTYFIVKRFKHKAKRNVLMIMFNPIFITIYFWLFVIVVYNSIYVPCGVSIVGVDGNKYTMNTKSLGFSYGEKLLRIDGVEITSLNDVRNYINGLDATKEVVVETDKSEYYIKTYTVGSNRFMGLLLAQAYCERQY